MDQTKSGDKKYSQRQSQNVNRVIVQNPLRERKK